MMESTNRWIEWIANYYRVFGIPSKNGKGWSAIMHLHDVNGKRKTFSVLLFQTKQKCINKVSTVSYPLFIGSSPLCRFVWIVPFSTAKSCILESFVPPVVGPADALKRSKLNCQTFACHLSWMSAIGRNPIKPSKNYWNYHLNDWRPSSCSSAGRRAAFRCVRSNSWVSRRSAARSWVHRVAGSGKSSPCTAPPVSPA